MFEAGVQSTPEPTRPTRPRQATTLAVLLVVIGALGVLVSFVLMSIVSDSSDHGRSVPALLYVAGYVQLVFSATLTLCGVFVWQGRSWARVLAIVLCALNIAGAVVTLVGGAVLQSAMGVVLNVAMLRLLSSDDVTAWCNS